MGILLKRRKQLVEIENNLPVVDFELNDEGYYINDYYELYFLEYFIIVDIYIYVDREVIYATNTNPSEWDVKSKTIDVVIKQIYDEEKEILFNSYQMERLKKSIINNINF